MSKTIRKYNQFEYHLEDLDDCSYCLFYKRKSRFSKNGCLNETCPFEFIRQDAINSGRIKRKRGWFSYRM